MDVALGALPFEENAVNRASEFEFYPGTTLRTCSAEDLVVMKAFAGPDRLDWKTIFAELTPLCELKDAPEIVAHLRQLEKSEGQHEF